MWFLRRQEIVTDFQGYNVKQQHFPSPFKVSMWMGKDGDLGDFDRVMVVGLSILETTDLL